jgi:carbonic anhydrase
MPASCQCSQCDSPLERLNQRDDLTTSPIANRRQFLRYLIGAGVMTTASLIDPAIARAEKKVPKALVLSCIDYRILEAERYFLSLQNLGGQYDFVALAGASLALSGLPHQYDAEAFWDQLDISYRLHQIKKVMILDHEDCSVYQYKIDPNLANSPELELSTHTEYLSRAYWAIRDRYPDLNIELYFVKLNTEVKQISPLAKAPSIKVEPKGQTK